MGLFSRTKHAEPVYDAEPDAAALMDMFRVGRPAVMQLPGGTEARATVLELDYANDWLLLEYDFTLNSASDVDRVFTTRTWKPVESVRPFDAVLDAGMPYVYGAESVDALVGIS